MKVVEHINPKPISARDPVIDAVRGFAVVLVVLGHVLQGSLTEPRSHWIYRGIYSFHMPLFVFLSGYVTGLAAHRGGFSKFLFKKFRVLVVPFLAWYFIVGGLLWGALFKGGRASFEYCTRIFFNPDWGLWFLWVLFLCFLCLIPILAMERGSQSKSDLKRYGLALGVALVVSLLPSRFLGIGILKLQLPFFFLAYFLAKSNALAGRRATFGIWAGTSVFLILAWSGFPISGFDESWLHLHSTVMDKLLNRALGTGVALSGICASFFLIRHLTCRPAIAALAWLGLFSLDIYAIQFWVPNLLAGFQLGFWMEVFLKTGAIIATCLTVTTFFLRRFNLLNQIFCGGR